MPNTPYDPARMAPLFGVLAQMQANKAREAVAQEELELRKKDFDLQSKLIDQQIRTSQVGERRAAAEAATAESEQMIAASNADAQKDLDTYLNDLMPSLLSQQFLQETQMPNPGPLGYPPTDAMRQDYPYLDEQAMRRELTARGILSSPEQRMGANPNVSNSALVKSDAANMGLTLDAATEAGLGMQGRQLGIAEYNAQTGRINAGTQARSVANSALSDRNREDITLLNTASEILSNTNAIPGPALALITSAGNLQDRMAAFTNYMKNSGASPMSALQLNVEWGKIEVAHLANQVEMAKAQMEQNAKLVDTESTAQSAAYKVDMEAYSKGVSYVAKLSESINKAFEEGNDEIAIPTLEFALGFMNNLNKQGERAGLSGPMGAVTTGDTNSWPGGRDVVDISSSLIDQYEQEHAAGVEALISQGMSPDAAHARVTAVLDRQYMNRNPVRGNYAQRPQSVFGSQPQQQGLPSSVGIPGTPAPTHNIPTSAPPAAAGGTAPRPAVAGGAGPVAPAIPFPRTDIVTPPAPAPKQAQPKAQPEEPSSSVSVGPLTLNSSANADPVQAIADILSVVSTLAKSALPKKKERKKAG